MLQDKMKKEMKILGIFILGVMLGAFAGYKQFASGQSASAFYMTFPYDIPPGVAIRIQGTSRTDALTRSGVTVWTEKEWSNCATCQTVLIIPR